MRKKFLFLLFCCIISFLLSGCFSGFSRLPEINFVGKSKEEVIRIFAANPEKAWGTHINICIPLKNTPPYHCSNNLYFKTVDEALADKRIQQAPALGGYFTSRNFFTLVLARDFYEVIFDKNGKVISQTASYIQPAM